MEHIRAPSGPWRELLTAAVAIALGTLLLVELGWRALDHAPNMSDDARAWVVERSKVYGARPRDRIVVLGASRVQLAVDTRFLRQAFPGHGVVQLAIDGRSPVAAFLDLAADERFDGVAVLDLLPDDLEPARAGMQQPYVDAFHRGLQLERRLERQLEMQVQGRLVLANPNLRLPRVLESLAGDGRLPPPYHVVTYPDRARAGRYELVDVAAMRGGRFARDAQRYAALERSAPAVWLARALALAAAAERIEARGGAVLILKLPVDAERAAFDERWYPRAQYWDAFVAASPVKVIDGSDEPELAWVPTPDASHIDARDRQAFTIGLARILIREGMLPPAGTP